MPFCTYCGQSFTRDEHLERHILTHTNVKPFKCFSCHMSFARRDLLQRHYTVHGKDGNQNPLPPSDGIIPKSAGRTPIACTNCAKTKTKCDKKTPCSRCSARNLVCVARLVRRISKNAGSVDLDAEPDSALEAPVSNSETPEMSSKSSRSSSTGLPSLMPKSHPEDQSSDELMEDRGIMSPSFSSLGPQASTRTPLLDQASVMGHDDALRMFPFFEWIEGQSDTSNAFNFDWTQLHEAEVDMKNSKSHGNMVSAQGLDMNLGMAQQNFDPGQFDFTPVLSSPGRVLQAQGTPIHSPGLDSLFGQVELDSATEYPFFSRGYQPSQMMVDTEAISQDAWSCFRCNPCIASKLCPNNLRQNLEKLEKSLRDHDQWNNLNFDQDEDMQLSRNRIQISPLQDWVRDKLLAITQAFLHKALEIHKDDPVPTPPLHPNLNHNQGNPGFVLLPPGQVLRGFLQIYASNFERYYALTPRGCLDVNKLMQSQNDRASSLLLLSMINYGAMTSGTSEARSITGGLIEACRISLFDAVEKNIMLAGDSTILHAALLFTSQGSWSGDKWHMDIAIGQRGMYTAMLRHSGVLDGTPGNMVPSGSGSTVQRLWEDWTSQEKRNRIAYSWAMVDLDLSLFHDTTPLMTVAEFLAPLPESESLWQATSADEWAATYQQIHGITPGKEGFGSPSKPASLKDLFRQFLDESSSLVGANMTALQLRLLLFPLQSLVSQLRQFFNCFGDGADDSLNSVSGAARTSEVQSLLTKWSTLADKYAESNALCPIMHSNLILFHLMSLNVVTDIAGIEQLARQENFERPSTSKGEIAWRHSRSISKVDEAVFRCEQVLRHMRCLTKTIRPPWWAAAIYRVTLVLWSVTSAGLRASEDTMMTQYSEGKEEYPVITRSDGSRLALFNPENAIWHGIEIIGEGIPTQFSDGIRSKLERLARRQAK